MGQLPKPVFTGYANVKVPPGGGLEPDSAQASSGQRTRPASVAAVFRLTNTTTRVLFVYSFTTVENADFSRVGRVPLLNLPPEGFLMRRGEFQELQTPVYAGLTNRWRLRLTCVSGSGPMLGRRLQMKVAEWGDFLREVAPLAKRVLPRSRSASPERMVSDWIEPPAPSVDAAKPKEISP